LNQDLLLERHYLDGNISLSEFRKWDGGQIPGIKALHAAPYFDPNLEKVQLRTPDPANFVVPPRMQPYFKLHGSSNWLSENGDRLLIMGGNKAVEINQYPLLNWYHQQFKAYLSRPSVRLMIIGYSFSDQHINEAIGQVADASNLSLYIIDPRGVDVLDKQNPRAPIRYSELTERLSMRIMGASRRPLSATFGHDRVEHSKLMRFFDA